MPSTGIELSLMIARGHLLSSVLRVYPRYPKEHAIAYAVATASLFAAWTGASAQCREHQAALLSGSHTAPILCPMGTLHWLRMCANYFGTVPRISAFCLSFGPLLLLSRICDPPLSTHRGSLLLVLSRLLFPLSSPLCGSSGKSFLSEVCLQAVVNLGRYGSR